MNRKSLYLGLAVALVLALGTPIVNACTGDAACDVVRTCEKTDAGMRCTIIAKGETTADQVRECVRTCAGSAEHADNVTVTFEDVDGGVVVIKTGADEQAVAALHTMADSCAKAEGCAKTASAGKGCCKKAGAEKAADGKDCPHAKSAASTGCDKAKTADDA